MHHAFDDRRYLIPFRATLLPQIFTDVLVIGGGVAGYRAAIAAADEAGHDCEVIVACKGGIKHSSTYWAQGGIAAVLTEEDSFAQHVEDTLIAGAGLCDEAVVREVVAGGPAAIAELQQWGMPLDTGDAGALRFGKEGGHSAFRIVHSDGDATGKALAQTLDRRVRQSPRIRLFDHCFVLDLITPGSLSTAHAAEDSGNQRVLGAITHHPKHGLQVIWAGATILASGGAGQVWRESTNPSSATGDGIAMAYRAGAVLRDMAFMQFHPTTLYVAGASRSLITEAVRGEGAHLIDRNGNRFMPDYDERAELAPRDIVARAILSQMAATGHTHVYLDARHLDGFALRFPGIDALLKRFDIDPAASPIPVHPSAHYMIGGVAADTRGRTSLPGLYACGEAAATGLHGANRLASNSLLEGMVLGKAAGESAAAEVRAAEGHATRSYKVVSDIPLSDRSELDLADVRSSLRSVMWRHVGIEREGERLKEVGEMFDFWARYTLDKIFDEQPGWEVQNMLTAGALVTRAAHWRAESRGTHYRADAPEPSDEFLTHDTWRRGGAAEESPAVGGVPA